MCITIEEKRKTFKLEVTLIHYIIETKSHFYIFIIYSSSSSISCERDYYLFSEEGVVLSVSPTNEILLFNTAQILLACGLPGKSF